MNMTEMATWELGMGMNLVLVIYLKLGSTSPNSARKKRVVHN